MKNEKTDTANEECDLCDGGDGEEDESGQEHQRKRKGDRNSNEDETLRDRWKTEFDHESREIDCEDLSPTKKISKS